MKKYIILAVLVGLCVCGAWFAITNKSNLNHDSKWLTYTHEADPSLSFSYPETFGQPRIVDQADKDGRKFQVDFGDYRFSVNNGYYFLDVDGKRPAVTQLLQGYEKDKEAKNEVRDFTVKEIRVANRPATEVDIDNLNGTHYTDVYVYNGDKTTTDFILITVDRSFVNESLLERILTSFKLR